MRGKLGKFGIFLFHFHNDQTNVRKVRSFASSRQSVFSADEKELLKKSVVFYRALNDNAADTFDLSVIDALKPYEIKTMLLPVIHRKEFVDLPQMKQTVKEYLSDLLTLNDEEQAFLRDFANKRYSPEKLFYDPDIRARIQSHPMVEWKMSR